MNSIFPKACVAASILATFAGCNGPRAGRMPLAPPIEPIPMQQAAGIVNQNVARVNAALRATGDVDGYFQSEDGRLRHYDVNGILFYLTPSFVRFDLKKLGDRQFLFGSNGTMYWVYSREGDEYHCGAVGDHADAVEDVPFRPQQIPAALGLAPIPIGDAVESGTPAALARVQRIDDEHQQILFIVRDAGGRTRIEKEYWLDRRPPQLVRRVVFRDADGAVEMTSDLDDYRPTAEGGPHLPHSMTAEWPASQARMRFRVDKWEFVPQVGPTGPQFEAPAECNSAG